MSERKLPEEWKTVCLALDRDAIHRCLNGVFRRLLSNLLLNFENDKFRQVKKDNPSVKYFTEGLPQNFVTYLFQVLGFVSSDGVYLFQGSKEQLKQTDAVYSEIETIIDRDTEVIVKDLRRLQDRNSRTSLVEENKRLSDPPNAELKSKKSSGYNRQEYDAGESSKADFSEAAPLVETVRSTLWNTGRIRNCFFEARDFTVRTMNHGRVYACSEKCDRGCLEAHWHLLSGKGMLYSFVAHLSPDGTQLLHMGLEHGYQYNSLPGSAHFGKTIHFSEKAVDENGSISYLKHPNKPVAQCVYCGELFSKLFL